jgi:hypothetical protein
MRSIYQTRNICLSLILLVTLSGCGPKRPGLQSITAQECEALIKTNVLEGTIADFEARAQVISTIEVSGMQKNMTTECRNQVATFSNRGQ